MKQQFNIKPFANYILRTPAFPIQRYLDLLENYSSENLWKFCQEKYFIEALQLASPSLASEVKKVIDNSLSVTPAKIISIEFSLLKYAARMCTRCTPFGLFAGCSTGKIAKSTIIKLKTIESYRKILSYDMHFWIMLMQTLDKNKFIRERIKFYPNNSIYEIGLYYRYIEFQYSSSGIDYDISAIKKTVALQMVLQKSKNGMALNDLIDVLAEEETERDNASKFIHELIECRFLVSELEATITGHKNYERIISILEQDISDSEEMIFVNALKRSLHEMNDLTDRSEGSLNILIESASEMNLEFDDKYIYQVDLSIPTVVNQLSDKISQNVLKAISFLNGIQKTNSNTNLKHFIIAYKDRYGQREMPLSFVLDPETGLRYGEQSSLSGDHVILNRFSFKNKKHVHLLEPISQTDFVLHRKLQEYSENKIPYIELDESDFPDFESTWEHTPPTFSVMLEIIGTTDDSIAITGAGNISAAKMSGRFCHIDHNIQQLTEEIIQKEQEIQVDKIMAEIVHIPQTKLGNILRRPPLRKFEIPYLNNASVALDDQILISDLMISIKEKRIILRSLKYNKEVIPCLSSAHNYANNTIPAYQFLCDMQGQGQKAIYAFSWGSLESQYRFFPRVMYRKVVISKAKWILGYIEFKNYDKITGSLLLEEFSLWREKRRVPRYINLIDSDKTLLLDLESEICIRLLIDAVKKSSSGTIEEFLFNEDLSVRDVAENGFTNQVLMCFYKEQSGYTA